ncbi:hypothetical protein ACFV9C_43005 [Kribbella sp. NPDC059898]|uniref:hypothetical protein n=1 Tax=Kribbella sp. NPDC059898 TaxID=3346995 RepID=UPI003649D36D
MPDVAGLTNVRAHFAEPGRQTVLYRTDEVGTSIALFLYRDPSHEYVPRPERAARLRTIYAGSGWHTPELLAHAPTGDLFMDTLTHIETPRWYAGRVVLIGDASGALTLASAQGASLAMAGGYLLAEALVAHPNDPRPRSPPTRPACDRSSPPANAVPARSPTASYRPPTQAMRSSAWPPG